MEKSAERLKQQINDNNRALTELGSVVSYHAFRKDGRSECRYECQGRKQAETVIGFIKSRTLSG